MIDNLRQFLGLQVALALLIVFGVSAYAAGPDEVAEIRIEGNQQMTDAAVLTYVKSRIGERYDEEILRDDERRLLKSGRFESVSASRTYTEQGVVVTFVVVERPTVSDVLFEGNKAFDYAQLAGELGFGASDPLNRFLVEAGRQALLEKYRQNGYHFVTVAFDAEVLQQFRQVVYRIVEGPRVVVTKIRFEGNTHFYTLTLRRGVGSAARIWPISTGHLNIEQVERDVQMIRNKYMAEGFLDVQVGRTLEFSQDKSKVEITFVIDEGPRFRVNEVSFEGNTVLSDQELARRLVLQQGEFFTALDLRRDMRRVQDTYGELGYIEVHISAAKRFRAPDAELPDWAQTLDEDQPALLNLIFTVTEADQYYIGRIDIRGNTVTQARIIRRELRFFPEQLYNMVAVEESRRRLLETRLFERVDITPIGRDPKFRNVLVDVAEGQTANFIIGAGLSTNSGLLGTVSFTQSNFDILRWPRSGREFYTGQAFKGAGQTFRIVAEPGTEFMRFHINWFEPYLFDQPYSLGTKAFLFTRGRESYDETRYGGVVSFGHRFKNRWYGELSSRLEGVNIDNLDDDAPSEVSQDAGTSVLVGLKGMLVRDRTDSRWAPSAGDRFQLSYEQVTGDYNFGLATGDYRIYRTIYVDALDRKHILAARVAVGNVFGEAPVFERFYGGGLGSLRGFEYRGISPRGTGSDDVIGGEFMIFGGIEYSLPLIGEQLRLAVFLDTGTVEEGFEITTYRVSAGAGLRWTIPMFHSPVPMSLDFGFPINKADQDDTQLVNFSFGLAF